MKELEAAVDWTAPHKSPGLDGLSYGFYKATLQEVGCPLLEAFNKMMAEGLLPTSFRQGIVCLLPKVGGVPAASQLRPIILLLTKILGACLACLASSPICPPFHSAVLCSRQVHI
jgi:hypothetical protein